LRTSFGNILLGFLVVYALIIFSLWGAGDRQFTYLHASLDSGNSILSLLLAVFLLVERQAIKPKLRNYLLIGFSFTAGTELLHVLAVIEWSGWLPWIGGYSGTLQPATWSLSAYVLPLALAWIYCLMRSNATLTPRIFALGMGVLTLCLSVLSFKLPNDAGSLTPAIQHPAQLPLLLPWVLVIAAYWRQRQAHRIFAGLAWFGTLLLLSDLFMLFSASPDEKFSMMAHAGKLLAYAMLLGIQMRLAAESSQARDLSAFALAQCKYTLDHLPDGVFIFHPYTLRCVYANQAALQQMNRSGEDWLRLTALDLKPDFTEQELRAWLQPLLDGSVAANTFKTVHRQVDGREITVEISLQFAAHGGPEPVFIAYSHDIANRQKSELLLQEQFHFVEQLIEAIPNPLFYKDEHGLYMGCNQAFEQFIGTTRQQLIGKSVYELSPKELADRYYAADKALFDHPGVQTYEAKVKSANGEHRDVMFFKATFNKSNGMLGGLVGVILDITERKKSEAELRIAATAFESHEGMLITDADNMIIRVNQAFTNITGYLAEEVIGKNPKMLSAGYHDTNFYAAMWKSLNSTGTWEGEMWNRRKSGEDYPLHLIISAVKDSNGCVTNYVASHADITQRKSAENEIKNLAFYDPLTKLPNRRLLLDRLQHALASSARSSRTGALLFIDLDNFKVLNDTLGHDLGDVLLKQVAQRLNSCVREGDTVARLGGDEFVVILEDLSEHAIEAAAQTETIGEKIRDTLSKTYKLAAYNFHNTPSIGATLLSGHQQSSEELMKQADIAMYQAKKAGRNTLRFFDPKMQKTITSRAIFEGDLRNALKNGQFHLHYQIQVDDAHRPLGAEALIRWIHPERGMVSPDQFIPVAEESGLILPIGEWVLESACAQLKSWQQDVVTSSLVLAVNISAKQIHETDFAAQVRALVQRHAINPRLLKLELTESMLLENIEDTIAAMHALKEIGVQFSLDDFGTGYSSLQYLKRLPLNQLKIDQSFICDIANSSSDQAIVRTVIAMAQSLNLDVIAEGVETEGQRQHLLHAGCNHFQGYLFGKPMPIGELNALLKQG
jgi:diguanylate cyclase (GGDEF)-like protein/PAS domain S-box-containing protein